MRIEISFTGLCAFVRNPSGASARVVLVDSSNSPPCDEHRAALLVPVSHWDQLLNQRVPSDRFPDQEFGGEDVVVLPISKEDLTFPTGSTSLSFKSGAILPPCPGTDREEFAWVARIKDFTGDGAMRNVVLTDAVPVGVAARISITSGEFIASGFRIGPDGLGGFGIIKYEFVDSGGVTDSRAFAEEVGMTDNLSIASRQFVISSTLFAGGAGPLIVIKEDNSRIRFRVVDLPLDKIKHPGLADPFEPDDCFAKFYDLGSTSGSILTPVLGDLCPPPGGGLSNPKCPCACFDDNPNA